MYNYINDLGYKMESGKTDALGDVGMREMDSKTPKWSKTHLGTQGE